MTLKRSSAKGAAKRAVSAVASETIIRSAPRRLGFATNVGMVRPVDEDSVLALEIRTAFVSRERTRMLLMVADGMGGHRRGETASRIAVQTASQLLMPLLTSDEEIPRKQYHRALYSAIVHANEAVFAVSQNNPEYEGMGTTLVLAIADGTNLHIANVGDSRGYLIDKREISQVTKDHSLVQEMVDKGEITQEEARHHPRKNVITMVLGIYDEVTPDIGCMTVEQGEMVLLCCDGLIAHVEDEEIHRVVTETSDHQRAVDILVALANKGGGTDNISVILAPVPSDSE